MNSINEISLFDRFLIMYDLCVFTCIIFIFVFHCTHVRMSYVLNSYLLTYLLNPACTDLLMNSDCERKARLVRRSLLGL